MITLTYYLSENDYLQHLLYTTSGSKNVKQKRRNSWIMITAAFFLLALVCYDDDRNVLAINFAIVGLVTLIFYPLYVRKQYVKLYTKHVQDNYKALIGEELTVNISDSCIEMTDRNSETKCRFSAFSSFNETKQYFYLRLFSSSSLIIPKAKIDNVEAFKNTLKSLAGQHKIKYKEDLDWEWK